MSWNNIKFKAILFDLDGTLIDSMPLHNLAWIETLDQHGCPMTKDILTEYTGTPNVKTVEIFNERFGWALDPKKIAEQKEASFAKNLKKVQSIDLVAQVVRENFNKIPMAIVTGSARKVAVEMLKNLDLEKYFNAIIAAEDTQNHKPHPEPFLLGAEILNISPKDCLVFEDGALGIQAAQTAGMNVVKVVRIESVFKLEF